MCLFILCIIQYERIKQTAQYDSSECLRFHMFASILDYLRGYAQSKPSHTRTSYGRRSTYTPRTRSAEKVVYFRGCTSTFHVFQFKFKITNNASNLSFRMKGVLADLNYNSVSGKWQTWKREKQQTLHLIMHSGIETSWNPRTQVGNTSEHYRTWLPAKSETNIIIINEYFSWHCKQKIGILREYSNAIYVQCTVCVVT